jgi:formyltetrahydrofolate synthetase
MQNDTNHRSRERDQKSLVLVKAEKPHDLGAGASALGLPGCEPVHQLAVAAVNRDCFLGAGFGHVVVGPGTGAGTAFLCHKKVLRKKVRDGLNPPPHRVAVRIWYEQFWPAQKE